MSTRQTLTPVPSIAVEVVTAVARHADVDEMELPPLSEVVDPDALDRLFARSADGSVGGSVRVGFEYCGVGIVVEGDRTVSIERSGRTSDAAVSAP